MASRTQLSQADSKRARWVVTVWLGSVAVLVLGMVLLGGITRLTGSGLSMVDWRPVTGVLPPLSHAQWQEAFSAYQQSPEYLELNQWMSLADFKQIFFWEYLHRLLGRTVGLVFFLPWVWFLYKGQLELLKIRAQTALAFVLGASQGVLGWWMVKSGLVDVPHVSHFRLAAHLGLAFVIALWLVWIIRGIWAAADTRLADGFCPSSPFRRTSLAFALLVGVQVIYGALVAGKHAGHVFSDFPLMAGSLLPEGLFALSPVFRDVTENPVTLHWMHRALGFAILAVALWLWIAAERGEGSKRLRLAARLVMGTVLIQVSLGALTVLLGVALVPAVMHQLGGFFVLATAAHLAATAASSARERRSIPYAQNPA